MSSDADGLVQSAIRAYKANKLDEAQDLLMQVTEADDENEQAWLWLSLIIEDVEDKRVCLDNVIYINENNTHAKQGLEALDRGQALPYTAADLEGAGATADYENAALSAFDMGFDAADDFLNDDEDDEFDEEDHVALSSDPFAAPSLDLDLGLEDLQAPKAPVRPKSPIEAPKKSAPASQSRSSQKSGGKKPASESAPKTMNGLFELIPSTIKATRVPGTRESNPTWLKRGIIILGVLNLVMVVLLVVSG